MKLNSRESIIIKTLLELGMKEEIAQNADAVKEVLACVNNEISINNQEFDELVQRNELKDRLSKMVDEYNKCFVYKNSEETTKYTTGVDEKKTFDRKVLTLIKEKIDIDSQGRMVKNKETWIREVYEGRNGDFPKDQDIEQDWSLEYPYGNVYGRICGIIEKEIISEGVKIEESIDRKNELYLNDVDRSKISETEILGKKGVVSYKSRCGAEPTLYNMGMHSGFGVDRVIMDLGGYSIVRNSDLVTGKIIAKQAYVDNDYVNYNMNKQYCRNFIIGSDYDMRYAKNSAGPHLDFYGLMEKLKEPNTRALYDEERENEDKEIDKYLKDKEYLQEIYNLPEYRNLAIKHGLIPGVYEPERVELEEIKEEEFQKIYEEEAEKGTLGETFQMIKSRIEPEKETQQENQEEK